MGSFWIIILRLFDNLTFYQYHCPCCTHTCAKVIIIIINTKCFYWLKRAGKNAIIIIWTWKKEEKITREQKPETVTTVTNWSSNQTTDFIRIIWSNNADHSWWELAYTKPLRHGFHHQEQFIALPFHMHNLTVYFVAVNEQSMKVSTYRSLLFSISWRLPIKLQLS